MHWSPEKKKRQDKLTHH